MPYAFRRQPLKGLYLTYQLILTLFVRFPLWTIFNIPRALRPKRTWSWKRAMLARLIRLVNGLGDQVGSLLSTANHKAIVSGAGINGVWVGAAGHLVTGKLQTWAAIAKVASVRLPGYWVHKKGTSIKVGSTPQPGEKVIYQLHGGAYIRLSANPKDVTATISKGYAKYIDTVQRVFSIEYRLASAKPFEIAYPFPTQLIDALAGYNYLVNVVGFAPENIIVSGDSAGANLAHALTRYLTEYQGTPDVPLPGPPSALILLSPWVDLGTGHDKIPNGSIKTNLVTDYLGPGGGIKWAKGAFCGPHGLGAAETNEYISPASLHSSLVVDFKKFPRTFIVSGGAEVLYDSILTLKKRMVADLGEGDGVKPEDGKVRYYEAPDAVHDYLVFMWHEPERSETYKAINKWIHAS
ncbi:alpha/beta-hydrolase [Pholiota conissans]|uniref:Alpha/beta-hydrolase n=1 Tax=Pholiota conissans TaxID=109636 RepID=A0A9P6CZA4_9AGAR|nr:alpha/beta-hydrolase [Pholiota conissans]